MANFCSVVPAVEWEGLLTKLSAQGISSSSFLPTAFVASALDFLLCVMRSHSAVWWYQRPCFPSAQCSLTGMDTVTHEMQKIEATLK